MKQALEQIWNRYQKVKSCSLLPQVFQGTAQTGHRQPTPTSSLLQQRSQRPEAAVHSQEGQGKGHELAPWTGQRQRCSGNLSEGNFKKLVEANLKIIMVKKEHTVSTHLWTGLKPQRSTKSPSNQPD